MAMDGTRFSFERDASAKCMCYSWRCSDLSPHQWRDVHTSTIIQGVFGARSTQILLQALYIALRDYFETVIPGTETKQYQTGDAENETE